MLRPNVELILEPNVGDEASLLCTEPGHGALPGSQHKNGRKANKKIVNTNELPRNNCQSKEIIHHSPDHTCTLGK